MGPRRTSGRKASRLGTLERRYDFHLGEAIRAALEGSHDKAATHSSTALSISRELYAAGPDPARHQPELAAALCNHARYGDTPLHVVALLMESAGHYAALAQADPAAYEVPRIDVLARIALTADEAGNTTDAISLLREVVRMYDGAPAADQAGLGIGLARARFHLGRCLLKTGASADGLAEIDAGLEIAADALGRLHVTAHAPGWLGTAPRYVQLAAPDWAAAAVRAMTLHAAAGRWESAASAASAAVLMSGGLAGLGGDRLRAAHETVRARADAVCARAERAGRIAGLMLLGLDEALPRALDLGLGGRAVGPAGTLDGLAGL
jgi:tetratricopeptide (TPR) repeat protein